MSEYLPQTPVERELVHRLASLFWRLRRATSIETGLLRMQSEILHAFQSSRQNAAKSLAGEGAPRAFAGTGPEFGLDVVSGPNGAQQPGFDRGRPTKSPEQGCEAMHELPLDGRLRQIL